VRRYVADTHVVLWTWSNQVGRLGKEARRGEVARDGAVELVISVVSLWEVALLFERGRIRLSQGSRRGATHWMRPQGCGGASEA